MVLTMSSIFLAYCESDVLLLKGACQVFCKEFETIRDVDSYELVSRLKPREPFLDGRTNAVKLYHVVEDGEKIYYLDFTSLYP